MTIKTQEAILSIYNKVRKRHDSAIVARSKEPNRSHQNIMLAGKVKAYVDIMCLLRDKYRDEINFPRYK